MEAHLTGELLVRWPNGGPGTREGAGAWEARSVVEPHNKAHVVVTVLCREFFHGFPDGLPLAAFGDGISAADGDGSVERVPDEPLTSFGPLPNLTGFETDSRGD
ncbi:hypothetical protein GCM10017752_60950 [Streptomyces roseoviridis]